MCAIKNLSKTKALETAPIHENEILTYIFNFQRIILKPASDGFQISTDSASAWVPHQALADLDAYLFCFLKLDFLNTKCEYKVQEGVKVNQLFTFFTSIITRNNSGMLGLGTSIVKMCQAFQTLRCNIVATTLSLVSCSHFLLHV